MGASKKKILAWAGVAAVIIAAIITASALVISRDNSAAGSDNDNKVSVDDGGGNCINNGTGGQQNCYSSPTTERDSRSVDQPPQGAGPWAFAVKDTVVDGTDVGLLVRVCNKQDCGCGGGHCAKIGIALNASTVHAMCQEDSGYNGNDTSSVWLKIKWPSNAPNSMQPFSSSPDDPYWGWVLAKYTMPAGHNGKIPTCT
jgi:hypothetical protein